MEDLEAPGVCSTEEDEKYLRMADQVEEILDLWYGFVGSHPHLVYYFTGSDGQPNVSYLNAVRERFCQWIMDTSPARSGLA